MSFFKLLFLLLFVFFSNICLSCEYNFKNDMIFIPQGYYKPFFNYSNKDDSINVSAFYINKYPISNIEFMIFVLNNPEWNSDNIKTIFADRNYLSHWREDIDFNQTKMQPVVNISWFAADAYCHYIGGRLPTLDEWEYVASASRYDPIGKNDALYLQQILDWYIKSQYKIQQLAIYEPNYWGVYCMHGIIWEWVNNFNSVILINTDAEGGGLEELLYCGAAAINAIDPADYMTFMRFAFRNSLEVNYTTSTLGFRCVKDVK